MQQSAWSCVDYFKTAWIVALLHHLCNMKCRPLAPRRLRRLPFATPKQQSTATSSSSSLMCDAQQAAATLSVKLRKTATSTGTADCKLFPCHMARAASGSYCSTCAASWASSRVTLSRPSALASSCAHTEKHAPSLDPAQHSYQSQVLCLTRAL